MANSCYPAHETCTEPCGGLEVSGNAIKVQSQRLPPHPPGWPMQQSRGAFTPAGQQPGQALLPYMPTDARLYGGG